MKRDSHKNEEHLKDLQEDIQFLLSNIRARENGLIFFLERFTTQCRFAEEFSVFKEEFMQKEKIYASQVSRIVTKYTLERPQHILQQVSTFWIKVKSIVKVSLERLKILNLLNEKIFARYEEIIAIINKNYDQQKGLEEFSSVENLLKKRNIDALSFCRNHFSNQNSDSKMSKNRSESAFKHPNKISPKKMPELEHAVRLHFDSSTKQQHQFRMKSLNQYKKKKLAIEVKNPRNSEKITKKIHKNLQKYQKCFEGAMKGNIECNIDKKKTTKQNEQALYDQLFKRNIPNHKMISKFIFGSCGMATLLYKKPKTKVKKVLPKLDKDPKQSKQLKLNRSKPNRQARERPQSSQNINVRAFEEEKRRAIMQTTVLGKGKCRKKTTGRIQKYHKLIKLIS